MTVYKISVGQYTRKQNWQEAHTLFVQFAGKQDDLKSAYQSKYSGFTIVVTPVKEVEVIEDSFEKIKEKPIEEVAFESKIRQNNYDEKIYVRLSSSDIPDYRELIRPVNEAQKALERAEKTFKEEVLSRLSVKRVGDFKRVHEGIAFNLYTSWLDFGIKKKK